VSNFTRYLKQPWVVLPVVATLAVGGWYLSSPDPSTDEPAAAAEA
jgi:hypothetical protein